MGLINRAMAQSGTDMQGLRLGFWDFNGNWSDLVATIVTWILILAAVVAFFYLIYSGFTYLTAGGNPDAAKKGQQGIINAVIGIIIIFLAYAIIRAVVSFSGTGTGSLPNNSSCTSDDECASGNCAGVAGSETCQP